MKTFKNWLIKSSYILLVPGMVSCTHVRGKESADTKTVSVKTVRISSTDKVHQSEYIGTVESDNSADLSFQVNGNIEKIHVQEGQSVQKGQLLAKLNVATFESQYRATKAGFDQAQDAYNRLSTLYKSNSLPEIKYVEAKSNVEQAEANMRIAKKNLDDCSLYAPFQGVIGRKIQEEGVNVMPGTPVFNLMRISTVKVKIAIPENEISSVFTGEECVVKISALDNRSYTGKVIEKGVVAHPVSHTYDIKVQLDNPQKEIMPGMVCKSYLSDKNSPGTIIVPLKAVQADSSGKHFVWLVDSHGKASCNTVVIGKLTGNGIAIEKGLKVGDELVVEGYQNLSPGAAVRSI